MITHWNPPVEGGHQAPFWLIPLDLPKEDSPHETHPVFSPTLWAAELDRVCELPPPELPDFNDQPSVSISDTPASPVAPALERQEFAQEDDNDVEIITETTGEAQTLPPEVKALSPEVQIVPPEVEVLLP